jgi:hypothetical protein
VEKEEEEEEEEDESEEEDQEDDETEVLGELLDKESIQSSMSSISCQCRDNLVRRNTLETKGRSEMYCKPKRDDQRRKGRITKCKVSTYVAQMRNFVNQERINNFPIIQSEMKSDYKQEQVEALTSWGSP